MLICSSCCALFLKEPGKKGPQPRYCSTECGLRARGRRVQNHGHNGYKSGCRCDVCKSGAREGMRGFFQKAGANPYRPSAQPKSPCEGGCGKAVRGSACRDCHQVIRSRKLASERRRDRAVAKLQRAAIGTKGPRAWMQGSCGECGTVYLRRDNDTPFCSSKCRRREAAGRRRALEAGCKITPGRRHAVHERDNWTCKICGLPVNRDAVVPNLEAPVIDHVIPLARGGEHGPDNWQTAHFYCNSYKRDLDMAEVA